MMTNKVMIKAIFPQIDKSYDIRIPVNEILWIVKKLTVKAVYDLNCINVDIFNSKYIMINKSTGQIYDNNSIVIDTDIRNGTEIIFLMEQSEKNNF